MAHHAKNNDISIHALLAESDGQDRGAYFIERLFLSTLSLRRATRDRHAGDRHHRISIHALLAESDQVFQRIAKPFRISIHALLAESDPLNLTTLPVLLYFYPRSPCGERPAKSYYFACPFVFLSTLSLRRATCINATVFVVDTFLSTLSLRRATWICTATLPVKVYFYPRSPCGERLAVLMISLLVSTFLSTLSLRRATDKPRAAAGALPISIHALLAESDASLVEMPRISAIFLSTLSLRRATAKVHKTVGHFCAYETIFLEIASSC